MIHKIKSLYDQGNGLSKKAIARELNISINTVRKYLIMDEATITAAQNSPERHKKLDTHRDYIIHLLVTFPRLSAVKVQRKLQDKFPELTLSSRTIRRYVQHLKETVVAKPERVYQPILDHVPGEQCQVDPGELRNVLINGLETTVHFVVFLLSFSRLMYVALSPKAIDTERFIQMHDAAFRYFGGVTAECVYDQTKLVVIKEEYRELTLNPRFHQYATHAGFRIHACEGYDPESKGKVEAGVKYVKGNALYGETFADWSELESYLSHWLDTIANQRIHATTQEVPQQRHAQQEQSQLKPYDTFTLPPVQPNGQSLTRKADKTGLISFRANKYSVPYTYQRGTVGISTCQGILHLHDLETGEEIAQHTLTSGKGKIIKNTHHYRDPEVRIAQLEKELHDQVGTDTAQTLCRLLKNTSPKIYKDQLAGVNALIKAYQPMAPALLEKLCQCTQLTATQLKDTLEAYQQHPDRLQPEPEEKVTTGALACFAGLSTEEGNHESA